MWRPNHLVIDPFLNLSFSSEINTFYHTIIGQTLVCMIWFFSSTLINRTNANENLIWNLLVFQVNISFFTSIGGLLALGTGRIRLLYPTNKSFNKRSSANRPSYLDATVMAITEKSWNVFDVFAVSCTLDCLRKRLAAPSIKYFFKDNREYYFNKIF